MGMSEGFKVAQNRVILGRGLGAARVLVDVGAARFDGGRQVDCRRDMFVG